MGSILSTIGSYAKAAVPGAIAARVGYKRGEEEREQREIAGAKQVRAEKRQSILDEINAKKTEAEIAKTRKETGLLGQQHPKLYDKPDVGDGPVLYNEDGSSTPLLDRLGQPIKRTPRPKAPVRGTPEYNEAVRQEAEIRSRYRSTGGTTNPEEKKLNDQIRNVNSQIGATDRATTANHNDLDSPEEAVKARGDSLRTRRDSLVHVGDSLNQVQRDRAGTKTGGTVPKLTTPTASAPATTKRSINQDQYEYLRTPTEKGGAGLSEAEIRQKYIVGSGKP